MFNSNKNYFYDILFVKYKFKIKYLFIKINFFNFFVYIIYLNDKLKNNFK